MQNTIVRFHQSGQSEQRSITFSVHLPRQKKRFSTVHFRSNSKSCQGALTSFPLPRIQNPSERSSGKRERERERMRSISTFITVLSLLPLLCHSFSPENPTDRRILVLLDDFSLKSSHSIFFHSLQSHGFDLDFKLADDPKLTLQRYGQYLYDALILFSPNSDSKLLADSPFLSITYAGVLVCNRLCFFFF